MLRKLVVALLAPLFAIALPLVSPGVAAQSTQTLPDFADLAERAGPAVVGIRTTARIGGGQQGATTYTALTGGNGGTGLVRTEDPKGGITIPGATQGTFDPVGAGVVSFVYTKWVDLGVQDPRILPFSNGTIVSYPQNDAIYVEAQMTTEHPTLFGTPNVSAIDSKQNSSNVNIMSQWVPIKLHDQTGIPGGAFTPSLPPIASLPSNVPQEYAGFPVTALNGKGYRFIRFRMYFQLDSTQTSTSPLPYVDKITTTFEFNF
jgi:hypothetical protein